MNNVNYTPDILPEDFRTRLYDHTTNCGQYMVKCEQLLSCSVKEDIIRELASNYSFEDVRNLMLGLGYEKSEFAKLVGDFVTLNYDEIRKTVEKGGRS